MTELNIHTERVDDIPILVPPSNGRTDHVPPSNGRTDHVPSCNGRTELFGFIQKMGIQDILDKLVNSHGNRQGLSVATA